MADLPDRREPLDRRGNKASPALKGHKASLDLRARQDKLVLQASWDQQAPLGLRVNKVRRDRLAFKA